MPAIGQKSSKDVKHMTKKQVAEESVRRLKEAYPDAICSLESTQPHELLIATRLSAQCTDARVNIVTQVLFDKYRTIHDFAVADLADVEAIVHPCGLYKTKARDIIAMCQMLERDFHSTVPDEMESLLKLPGIGRKTANLVLGDVYGKPAVVCDTYKFSSSFTQDSIVVLDEFSVVNLPEAVGVTPTMIVSKGMSPHTSRP